MEQSPTFSLPPNPPIDPAPAPSQTVFFLVPVEQGQGGTAYIKWGLPSGRSLPYTERLIYASRQTYEADALVISQIRKMRFIIYLFIYFGHTTWLVGS